MEKELVLYILLFPTKILLIGCHLNLSKIYIISRIIIRQMYSSPSKYGAVVVSEVLNNP